MSGYDVHTTIDSTIQMYAEKALEEGIQKFDVINGAFCVVMDPDRRRAGHGQLPGL